MSETVSNAYLLLLGQIGLTLVGLLYGLPLAFFDGVLDAAAISTEELFFVGLTATASMMMVINIVIGWSAVRSARAELPVYSSRLFTCDLLIIFVLFGMNNVIASSLGAGLSAFDTDKIIVTIQSNTSALRVSMTLTSLIALSVLYLTLCKVWNYENYRLRENTNFMTYERQLTHVIVIQLLVLSISFLTLWFAVDLWIKVLCCLAWIATWIAANRGWLLMKWES